MTTISQKQRLGWKLMGYPMEFPCWRYIYRFGAWLFNRGLS